MWFVKLALLRLIDQWRSILTIIIGVLLTATIGASVPLYTNAIAQIGLQQRLEQRPTEETNIYTRLGLSTRNGDIIASWNAYNDIVNEVVSTRFADLHQWQTETVNWGETSPMFVVQDDVDLADTKFKIAAYDHLPEHVRFMEGAWPAEGQDELEIAISEGTAATYNLSVGETIILDQRGWETSLPITAHITGIFQPLDAENDPFWAEPSPLRAEVRGAETQMNVFVNRTDLERVITEFVPQTTTQVGWRLHFDHENLPFSRINEAETALDQIEEAISIPLQQFNGGERINLTYVTSLGAILTDYEAEVALLGAPFGLLLLQLAALVLFFLVVMGALVRRTERREIGMLKSRGAQANQILLLRGMETLIVCIVAALIGPTVARLVLIGLIPMLADIHTLPLELTPETYLYSSLASGVALVVLVATLIPILQIPLVTVGGKGLRSETKAWWQRYYLDVILLVIGFGAMFQLVNSGSLLAEGSDTQSDPLLLLVPTLLVFALGSISLRLFPAVMQAITRYFQRRNSVASILASWQVSREPLHYGRITFLLALAISIGWFAISFQRTVVQSQHDRAAYRVGADVRVSYDDHTVPEVVQQVAGVAAVSPVLRLEGVPVSTRTLSLDTGNLLGVQPQTIGDVAYTRSDLDRIQPPAWEGELPTTGLELPTDINRISLWANYRGFPFFVGNTSGVQMQVNPSALLFSQVTLVLRLRDAEGVIHYALLAADPENTPVINEEALPDDFSGNIAGLSADAFYNEGWINLEAQIDLPGTLRLEGIAIRTTDIGRGVGTSLTNSELLLRDLTVFTDTGDEIPLTWFNTEAWDFINVLGTRLDPDDANVIEDIDPELQAVSTRLDWIQDGRNAEFGLLLNYPQIISTDNTRSQGDETPQDEIVPIPVIVSRTFAEENALQVGQRFKLNIGLTTWFEVAQISRYYPSLYEDEAPFLIADESILLYTLQRHPRTEITPNELWVSAPDDEQQVTLEGISGVRDVYRVQDVLDGLQTDLLSVGLIGLLVFSSLIGFVLSIVSLVTYTSLSVQDRRMELAVLRAMGFTTGRLVLTIAIEQLFVIAAALLLGVGIGVMLSTLVLPVLSVNTSGSQLTPPFLVTVDPVLLVAYILSIIIILVMQLLFGSLLVRRLATIQALRRQGD